MCKVVAIHNIHTHTHGVQTTKTRKKDSNTLKEGLKVCTLPHENIGLALKILMLIIGTHIVVAVSTCRIFMVYDFIGF